MKLQHKQTQQLQAQNVADVLSWAEQPFQSTPYYGLVLALAEMLDQTIKGENNYLTAGLTQQRTAVALSWHQGPLRDTDYAPSLAEAADQALGRTETVPTPF